MVGLTRRFSPVLGPLALSAVLACGCGGDPHGLTWRILLPDEAGPRPAAIEARILRGGCGASDEVVYRADVLPSLAPADAGVAPRPDGTIAVPDAGVPLPDAGPDAMDATAGSMDGGGVRSDAGPGVIEPLSPPRLAPGTYGFAATGRDATCHIVFAGCTQITLPATADPTTVETVLLAVGGSVLDCPATRCDNGRCEQVDAGPPRPDGAVPDGSTDTGVPPADACVPLPPGVDTCTDGLDGDCNGLIDCADPGCAGDPACDACIGVPCGECEMCAGGACVAMADGSGCGGGACYGGACCTGCWNGTDCQAGDTPSACGVGGGACSSCACASDSCSGGSCGIGVQVGTISAGARHACAIDIDGRLWCWGDNSSAQLGVGPGVMGADAPRFVDAATDWQRIEAGGSHTCAIKTDGSLYCWGQNARGQLGIGDTVIRNVPTNVAGSWSEVSAGVSHTCALRTAATVACWGGNTQGEAGAGAGTDHLAPNAIDGSSPGWTIVTAGDGFSCGVRTGGVYCWGQNADGQLGNGAADATAHPTPTGLMGSALPAFAHVAASYRHACARTAMDEVYCWGAGSDGQLGGGLTASSSVAAPASMLSGFTNVAAGYWQSAAVHGGELYTWGGNTSGELGDPASTGRSTPDVVVDPAGTWTEVTAGDGFSCGVMDDGSVWCWGSDAMGRLGNGADGDSPAPVRVCF